jgi:hypothetical protein
MRSSRRLQAALCVAAVGTALAVSTGTALAAPGVTPATVTLDLAPGASTTITKTVSTPPIPPKPDIVFLVDTTGSMGSVISNVQSNAHTILNDVASAQPDAQFAVAEYKDAADSPPFRVVQNLTANQTAVSNGLDALAAGGGGDAPEDGINGLFQVSTGAVTFRPGSARIVLLIGDAPSHDPSNGHTLNAAISALQAADITVIALDLSRLDSTGQATAITNATGGQLFSGITPSEVSNTILTGLHNLPVTVTHALSGCDPALTVALTPASRTVTSGDDATFTETITVSPSATAGTTLTCSVNFLLNGTLSAGFTESITEHVPKATPAIATTPSGSVPAGGNIADTATVTGGSSPTGTVTFQLFAPGDTGCATPIATRTGTLSGGTASAGNIASGGAGTYRWVATYNGDANNNPVTSPCGSEQVVVTKATPAIATDPSGSVPAGGNISDTATVSGGFGPTGTVAFQLFAPGDSSCTTPIATRTGTLSGGTASSGNIASTQIGTYNWVATYSGDANNNSVVSPCGSEQVVIVKATPAIATTPSGSVPAGGNISDSATVSGGFGPTGTVTFQLFAAGDTGCATPIATRTGTLSGGTAGSGNIAADGAGTYRWVATYNGDANNNTVMSPCGSEQVVVTKATPAIATDPSGSVPAGGNISDSATVSGGFGPTGTVTFTLFAPGDTGCATPIATRTATLSGGTAGSGNIASGGVGTYRWVATYNGDANNNAVTSPCGSEQVVVTKATPAIATTPSGTVPAGGNVSDTATVSGGFGPTGTVTFTLFAPGDTGCATPIATRTGTLSGGTAASGSVQIGAAGIYRWVASYSGDANNNAVTSPCGSEQVTVTPQVLTGRAYGLAAQAALLGAVLVNVPPTPDTGHISTTSSTTTSVPCVASVGGLVSAHVLCAQVATTAFPGRSAATASVADASVGITGIPLITLTTIQSSSTTTCAGSTGTTTIAFLKVGDVTVISQPTNIAPNTTVNVGVVKLVLNEQIPFSSPDRGLTVNAVHITVNTLGLARTDVVLASSESDIGNCP